MKQTLVLDSSELQRDKAPLEAPIYRVLFELVFSSIFTKNRDPENTPKKHQRRGSGLAGADRLEKLEKGDALRGSRRDGTGEAGENIGAPREKPEKGARTKREGHASD